jgi:HEAT repeat protein
VAARLVVSADPEERWRMLHALGDEAAGEPLTLLAARAGLLDSSVPIRCTACEVLGKIGRRDDVRRLAVVLAHDRSWLVRSDAADALGSLAYASARPVLRRAVVEDLEPIVRRDAARALGSIDCTEDAAFLIERLDVEKESQAWAGIVTSLVRLAGAEWLPELLGLLEDEEDDLRHVAVNFLGDLDPLPERERVIQALEGMSARETNPGIRIDARKLLYELRGGPVRAGRVGAARGLATRSGGRGTSRPGWLPILSVGASPERSGSALDPGVKRGLSHRTGASGVTESRDGAMTQERVGAHTRVAKGSSSSSARSAVSSDSMPLPGKSRRTVSRW